MHTYLKKPTKQAVCRVATSHILAEGFATTLGVKLAMRRMGYHAQYNDIAEKLYDVAQRHNWYFNDNGFFRMYFFWAARVNRN